MVKLIKIAFIAIFLGNSVELLAQHPSGRMFSPEKFEAALEQFITTEALLTPKEAATFFPLYREMRKKQLGYIIDQRRFRHVDIRNEQMCEDVIRKADSNEIKVKELQQIYHNKFLEILPPSKVFQIINAENKFHRQAMKHVADRQFRPHDVNP